jgi:hypothetical protein
MSRSIHLVLLPTLCAAALVLATPAAADARTKQTSTVTFGPFVDDETCAFPITTAVERTRTTIVFADGDEQRHVQLIVTTSANGKTLVERDAYTVFVDSDAPDLWVITGAFTHARQQGGRTIALQSGRLAYDVEADTITDPQPGPHPTRVEDVVCAALSG